MKQRTSTYRVYYQVPYTDREAAKAVGARWDPAHKLWYAPTLAVSDDMEKHWKSVYVPGPQDAAYAARHAARRYWRTSAYI